MMIVFLSPNDYAKLGQWSLTVGMIRPGMIRRSTQRYVHEQGLGLELASRTLHVDCTVQTGGNALSNTYRIT